MILRHVRATSVYAVLRKSFLTSSTNVKACEGYDLERKALLATTIKHIVMD